MKHVLVVFKNGEEYGGKKYAFKTSEDRLRQGDLVVVETRYGYSLAKVLGYSTKEEQSNRYVVQKVDLDTFNKEKEVLERREQIEAEIQAEVKREGKMELYKELSERNPLIKELYEELISL